MKKEDESFFDFINILKIFDKKAIEVESNKDIICKPHRLKMSFNLDNKSECFVSGFNKRDEDILCLPIRHFYQVSSDIEINKIINKIILYSNYIDNDIVVNSKKIREQYKKFLSSGIKIKINLETINDYNDLLKLFFNGDKFHVDKKQIRVLDSIERSPFYSIAKQSFFSALQDLSSIVCFLNNVVIKKIIKQYNINKL